MMRIANARYKSNRAALVCSSSTRQRPSQLNTEPLTPFLQFLQPDRGTLNKLDLLFGMICNSATVQIQSIRKQMGKVSAELSSDRRAAKCSVLRCSRLESYTLGQAEGLRLIAKHLGELGRVLDDATPAAAERETSRFATMSVVVQHDLS